MSRIGILGGTFNPIHTGHLAMAQIAHDEMKLDKVVFVPSNIPPHKHVAHLASPMDRYRMVRLAIRGNTGFTASDVEINRRGKSYTIDTLRYFKSKYSPTTKFFFIIGADMLATLKRWKCIDEILTIVRFVVIDRPYFQHNIKTIPFHMVPTLGFDISSSFLRRQIRHGKSIKYLVPDSVFKYIKRHKLYH